MTSHRDNQAIGEAARDGPRRRFGVALAFAWLRRRPLLLAGSCGALVALAVGAGLLLGRVFEPKKGVSLLIPADRLPEATTAIGVITVAAEHAPKDAVDNLVLGSSLAPVLCGGVDLVAELRRHKGAPFPALQRAGLASFASDSMGAGLRCGVAFASSLEGRPPTSIVFADGEASHLVYAVPRPDPIPAALDRVVTWSDLEGKCATGGGECANDSVAGLADGPVWYAGRASSLAAFAKHHGEHGRSSNTSSSAALLTTAMAQLPLADVVDVRFRPPSVDLTLPCVLVAPPGKPAPFLADCLPAGVASFGRDLALRAKVVALARDHLGTRGGFRLSVHVWTRSDEDASAAERTLEAFVSSWKAQLGKPGADGRLLAAAEGDRSPAYAAWRATARTWLRAFSTARVARDDTWVTLRIEAELAEDDKAALGAALEARDTEVAQALEVVAAVIGGKDPPEAAVAYFFGEEAARWLGSTVARRDDCKAIAEHVNSLDRPGGVPGLSDYLATWGGMTTERADGTWGVSDIDMTACSRHRLTPQARQCLLETTRFEELSRCALPIPPDDVLGFPGFGVPGGGEARNGAPAGKPPATQPPTSSPKRKPTYVPDGI